MSEQKDVSKELVTVDDLDRIFIRVQDERGTYVNVHVKEATDIQFANWAASRMTIEDDIYDPWPLEERAIFCNDLWQAGQLVMLRKDVKFEEGQTDEQTT